MRPVKIVIMSSLDGGVGKTTLASVLSAAKGYVLLIDMDWEKADLSQLFRAPPEAGVAGAVYRWPERGSA